MAKKETGKATAEKVTKAKADFRARAEAKAKAHQTKRLEFIAQYGRQIAAQWAKLGDKGNVMAVSKTMPKEPVRLIHYALVSLGLLETKDGGLINWMKADKAVTMATSQPKARKATKKEGTHEASATA